MRGNVGGGLILVVVSLVCATGCARKPVKEPDLAALADRPAERTTRPWCVPDGPRVLRAGLRYPTWCTVHYAEGNGIWRRDAFNRVVTAGRMWHLWNEHAERWPHLRDSVTAAAQELAKGVPSCLTDVPFGNGGRVTVWELPGYDLAVERFERMEGRGAYELQIGVMRGHRQCPASREPAP
jgi:hypothetical protein